VTSTARRLGLVACFRVDVTDVVGFSSGVAEPLHEGFLSRGRGELGGSGEGRGGNCPGQPEQRLLAQRQESKGRREVSRLAEWGKL
jgi:hypothetical protein